MKLRGHVYTSSMKLRGHVYTSRVKIRGHAYTWRVENVTHIRGTSVLTPIVKEAIAFPLYIYM